MIRFMEEIKGYNSLIDNGAGVDLANKYGVKIPLLDEEITSHVENMQCSKFYRIMFNSEVSIMAIDNNKPEVTEVRIKVVYCNPESYKRGVYKGRVNHYINIMAIAYDITGAYVERQVIHSVHESSRERALQEVKKYLQEQGLEFLIKGTKEHNKKVFELIYNNKKNNSKDTTRRAIESQMINEFRNDVAINIMIKHQFITVRTYKASSGEVVYYYSPTETGTIRLTSQM